MKSSNPASLFTALSRLKALLGAALLLALAALPASAQTCNYTVTSLADSGAGSLRAALADSTVTDICFSVQGTITLASPLQIYYPVTITDPGGSGVTISGNGQVQIMVINTGLTPVVAMAKSKRPVAALKRPVPAAVPNTSTPVRLNGLTLTGGSATDGGAIQVVAGNVVLVSTAIKGNSATAGGGIYNQDTLTLSQCAISSNTGTTGAGGVDNESTGFLTDQGSAYTSNSSTSGAGAVYNNGSAQFTGGFFTSNTGVYGGAIDNDSGGQLTMSGGTTFTSNVVTAYGGAIYNYGTANITQALFNGNAAQSTIDLAACGGALCAAGGSATVTESTFTTNTSTQNGGAIGTQGYGSLTLLNDTIVGNTASLSGSGLDVESIGPPDIDNTIIANNTPIAGAANSDCNTCSSQNGSNNLIAVNPYLGPLALNGGPTQSMMPLPGGPAYNGGNPSLTSDTVDQRGFSRLSGSAMDIGAVQSHYNAVTYLTPPSNGTPNQPFASPVAVQVLEVDGNTQNYPLGVPVTVSLFTSQGVQAYSYLSGTLTQSPVVTAGVTAATFPDLSVSTVGSYEMLATIVPVFSSASQDPAFGVMSPIFQIAQPAVVTLNWQPAPVTYGPMPQSEFNAAATINGQPATGTFVYTFTSGGATINPGQIYPVAVYGVQVTFTPTGSTSHYTLGTSLQVNPATPTLAWPTPAPIFTSTPLSATQLNASATGVTGGALPGSFVYTPAAGTTLTAGPHTLSTTFTPTDTTDYTTASTQVAIQVNAPTASTVTVHDSANPITYGQSETLTASVTGTDGNPLSGGTATFSVDGATIGSAPVVNGTASVSSTTISGGAHTIGLTYTNTSTNQTLTSSTSLTVNKAAPTLAWPTPAPIYPSTPLSATQLDASATGVTAAALPGSFVYNPAAGATLTAGPHVLSTTFTPTDTIDYTTATTSVTIQVNAATPASVTVQDSANPITFGQTETFTASVTGSDGQPFSGGTAAISVDGTLIGSAPVANGTASVTAATLTAGTHQVAVAYTGPVSGQNLSASTSLTVNQATPKLTWPTPAAIYTSTPLSATQLDANATGVTGAALPGSFVYTPAAGTLLTAGPHALSVTFTPTDATDYNTATTQVTIQVNAPTASTVVIQESSNPITFGQSETFTAIVTGSDGKPLTGGTATFTSDAISLGASAVTNGSASITASTLSGGTHIIGVTYSNPATSQTLTSSTSLTVNKATPTLAWPTPAPIYPSTPLSATQLDAGATGVTAAALPGTFLYNPAAGTTLTAGPHVLSTTFTPTDTTDYTAATSSVTIQVNAATPASVTVQDSANPITFGQSETFTASVTGSDGKPFSGGTAAISVDGTLIGSAPVVNGTASVSSSTLTAGTHQVALAFTGPVSGQNLSASTSLTVNKAAPKLTWPTPAAIYTSTPLSATQLNANATGITSAALPGTFVYTPAAGTLLTAGPHALSVTFTPTDATDYTTATAGVTIQVNTPTVSTVAIEESANPITYGQTETFTAIVTGSDGKPLSGGTATFTSDGISLGATAVTNGSASITAASLAAGSHTIGVAYSNPAAEQSLSSTAALTVNKATPKLSWPAPAPITISAPLSATQLDASAAGVTGTALPGSFVYNPGAGTILSAGQQLLTVTFTPTDSRDYTTATAQVTLQVGFNPITLSAINPASVTLSSSPLSIQITGSGFTSTSVVLLGNSALATTVQSATALTAVVPAKNLATPGTLILSVYDSTSKLTSNTLSLSVTAQAADISVSVPATVTSGEQPTIGLNLATAYPVDLAGTLTLTFTPSGSGIDDPAVQFATGGRTLAFTIPAGSLTSPQVALQTGTVAGTINVTLVLTANGVDVTPAGVSPITLVIAPAAPVITSVSFTNANGLLTVVINGFSNTREVTQADFVFSGSGASALNKSSVTVPVGTLFSPWYSATSSDQYGSAFSYTQNFQLSSPDASVTGVAVTLTNSIGTSGSANSQ